MKIRDTVQNIPVRSIYREGFAVDWEFSFIDPTAPKPKAS